MQIQRQISKKNKRKLVGREYDVLALGPSEETDLLWEGRTEMHAPEIDGKLFINDFGDHEELVPGTFYRCEITEAHDYDLVARIVELNLHHLIVYAEEKATFAPLSYLPHACAEDAGRLPLLQRPLPHHRSGQMGQRRLRDLHQDQRS